MAQKSLLHRVLFIFLQISVHRINVNEYMKQVTQNTEFIIGIDFGHGETSAAFYDLKNQEKKDLDILPGLKVVKSAVAILEQEGKETISIGDAAIQNAPLAKDFQIAFKKRPSEMNKIERGRMVAFMKGVYAEILNNHPDYKTRHHVVYIARPSQDELWKSEEEAYLKIAEDAGLPVAGIQKESRAAYFRARTQPDSKIDKQVRAGVLIVDFGSSTIDFTYLNSKLSKPIDDGSPLGASEVEKTLLRYAMGNPSDGYMPEFVKLYGNNKESIPYNQMLYKFREAKEQYYGKKLPVFSVSFDYGLLTSSEKTPIYGFGGIAIPREKIKEILGENREDGYIWKVKDAVKSFKKNKLKDNKVACVYLTGGASRMDFVRQVFMEAFNLDEAHCPSDDNPSVIVSQGVAHLSYADILAKEKEKELKNIAQNAISQYNWNDNICKIVKESIKAKIIDKAWNVMIAYKDGRIGEYMTLKNGTDTSTGKYIGREGESNGFLKIRNVHALRKEIISTFESLVHYDFAKACEESITNNILNSVINKLKDALQAFEYNPSTQNPLQISDLSASISSTGANQLSDKFTGNGEGHIIRDAIASCWLIMLDLDVYKDRWDSDRKQHYDYYRNHYANIFNDYSWNEFLKKEVKVSGIESVKKQTQDYIDGLVNDYVSYAKLAIFF